MRISNIKETATSDLPPRTFLDVNSCGTEHLTAFDHTMLREEGRNDYQILYIAKGCCYAEIDGKMYKATAGNIILYKPHVKQKYTFYKKDKSILCYIHFTGKNCNELLDKFGLNSNMTYVGENEEINKLFSKLENEFLLKNLFYENICSGIFLQILAVFGKFATYHNKAITAKNEVAFKKICQHINTYYNDKKSVEQYAIMANLSVSRFTHLFKEIMGVSPKHYILNAKLSHACHLLETTSLSIAEIALEVGFDDVNYFSRVMKKYKGQTPKHFRK